MNKQLHTRGSALGALVIVVGGIISSLTDNDPATAPNWNEAAAMLALAYNAWWSRQSNVSSEEVGAKAAPGGP